METDSFDTGTPATLPWERPTEQRVESEAPTRRSRNTDRHHSPKPAARRGEKTLGQHLVSSCLHIAGLYLILGSITYLMTGTKGFFVVIVTMPALLLFDLATVFSDYRKGLA